MEDLMQRKLNILLIVVMLGCACAPVQKAADTLGLAAGTAKVLLTEVNQTETPQPTPKPSRTPTLEPLSQPVEMTTGEDFASWQLTSIVDDQKPELFIEQAGSFTLDPNWKVDRVEFVYKWWGNGDPVMDYQYLFPAGGNFTHNSGKTVSKETLAELLGSLTDLQPEPGMLSSLTHADDFHAWYIEINGADGETVLVQSTSNSRKDGAPWNVYYNGHYYAQFGDTLLLAIQKVFPHEPYDDATAFSEAYPSSKVVYNVEREDVTGFPSYTGLLPLRGDFEYFAGEEGDGLFLFIRSEGFTGFIPDTVKSVITSVSRVEIATADNPRLRCSISGARSSYMGEGWTVLCPVDQPEGETTFRLPVQIQFSTSAGQNFTTKGVLSSSWGFENLAVPVILPGWMADALARDPHAAPLWRDHVLYDLEYIGSTRKGQTDKDTLYGEAILLGETQWQGRTLRYTVATPFEFIGDRLTRWDLTREDINGLLADLQTGDLAKVALGADEDAVVNLYIASWRLKPDLPSLWNTEPVNFDAEVPAFCSVNPKVDVPNADQQFQAFAFSSSWYQSGSFQQQFVVVDDVVVPVNFIYYSSESDPVAMAIKPVSLNDRRFQAARLISIASDMQEGSSLVLMLNENLSTRGKDDLHAVLVDYFNDPIIDLSNGNFWTVEDIGLVVYPDGTLDFIRCEQ
jgi:hypothetical protein